MGVMTITLIPHYDFLYEILDLLLPINTQRHTIFVDSLLSLSKGSSLGYYSPLLEFSQNSKLQFPRINILDSSSPIAN